MQLLLSRIVFTFADDLAALVTGAGRIALHLAMSPFEPIAKACDVAGVLAARQARMQAAGAARLRRPARSATGEQRRARLRLTRCCFSFHFLSNLT